MQDAAFAYSLSQREDGWSWRVYDEDGATVAGGAHATQAGAEAAVHQTMRRAQQGQGAAGMRV